MPSTSMHPRPRPRPRAVLNVLGAFLSETANGARYVADEAPTGVLLQEQLLVEFPSLHFAAVGDWGASLTSSIQRSGQQAVADGVASWLDGEIATRQVGVGDEHSTPFIISLGDNFYPVGVKDEYDMAARFDQSFGDIYSHDAFHAVPWYVTAGNKDYGFLSRAGHLELGIKHYVNEADITAQMNFTGSSRWIYPDYFHRVVRKVSDNLKVEILLIDTMQLSGSLQYPKNKKENSSKHTSQHIADWGLQWIEHHLEHSDANYLIVAGHFPAHSVSGLEEMLETHKVSAYVGGHVHCQEHERKHQVDYFISGAGMELNCHEDTIDHEDATGGFLSFQAGVDKMVVRFHDQSGKEIHNTEISPRGSVEEEHHGGKKLEEESIEIE